MLVEDSQDADMSESEFGPAPKRQSKRWPTARFILLDSCHSRNVRVIVGT